jgi:hypothetical protein
MTRFGNALIAVVLLAATGCYATVRGTDGYSSSGHPVSSGYPGNSRGHDDRGEHHGNDGHAHADHDGDRDHD